MTKLETPQKENEHLRDLLEQVYEMSGLDDMITSGCLDHGGKNSDDDFLLHNLSLKSQVMEALSKRKLAKELKPLITEESLAKSKHNNSYEEGKK